MNLNAREMACLCHLGWTLGFEFTTQKQGFGVKSKHSPFIDTLIVSQGTVPSLIPCKNSSVRLLLWLRRRYLLSTITVCRLPFKTTPTSWTVTRTCDCVINDIKYSLRFEIQPIQKKARILFVTVMSVVFLFYLSLRPLQNMQCFSLGSFWKLIQV